MTKKVKTVNFSIALILAIAVLIFSIGLFLNATLFKDCSIEFSASGGIKDLVVYPLNATIPVITTNGTANGQVYGKVTGACIILAQIKR